MYMYSAVKFNAICFWDLHYKDCLKCQLKDTLSVMTRRPKQLDCTKIDISIGLKKNVHSLLALSKVWLIGKSLDFIHRSAFGKGTQVGHKYGFSYLQYD